MNTTTLSCYYHYAWQDFIYLQGGRNISPKSNAMYEAMRQETYQRLMQVRTSTGRNILIMIYFDLQIYCKKVTFLL